MRGGGHAPGRGHDHHRPRRRCDHDRPGRRATTTVPGDTTSTEAGATTTEAPASTEEEGAARPVPAGPSAVTDGEYAAAPLARQEETTTTAAEGATTTTAAEGATTTAPADGATTTVPGDTTTTAPPVDASDPAAEAANTIVVPDRPDPDAPPIGCAQVGPTGFEGGALSKSQAELNRGGSAGWIVSIAIKGSQQSKANELINACAGGQQTCPTGSMAMVLDGEVISAPTVQGPNLANDDFQITGGGTAGFTESQAKDLALKLRYGALPVEFTRSAERQVSPTLGEDSLRAGILAGLIGLLAVAIYLIVYYRALGVVVILGLGVWSALMYGTVCWLSASRG